MNKNKELEIVKELKEKTLNGFYELGSLKQANGTYWDNGMRAIERAFDEIIEALTPPTEEEVCDMLSNHIMPFTKEEEEKYPNWNKVYYDKQTKEFYYYYKYNHIDKKVVEGCRCNIDIYDNNIYRNPDLLIKLGLFYKGESK